MISIIAYDNNENYNDVAILLVLLRDFPVLLQACVVIMLNIKIFSLQQTYIKHKSLLTTTTTLQ
jgi:hypothetical protein